MTGASNPESRCRPEWHFCLSVLLCEFRQCAFVAPFFLFLVCLRLPVCQLFTVLPPWTDLTIFAFVSVKYCFLVKSWVLLLWFFCKTWQSVRKNLTLIFTFKGCTENLIIWILLNSGISWISAQKAFTSDKTNKLSVNLFVCLSNKIDR